MSADAIDDALHCVLVCCRELNQMLKAWEAMRLGKDAQIAALMERCKRHEEDAAEKARTADALRRKLAVVGRASGGGSVAGVVSSVTPLLPSSVASGQTLPLGLLHNFTRNSAQQQRSVTSSVYSHGGTSKGVYDAGQLNQHMQQPLPTRAQPAASATSSSSPP